MAAVTRLVRINCRLPLPCHSVFIVLFCNKVRPSRRASFFGRGKSSPRSKGKSRRFVAFSATPSPRGEPPLKPHRKFCNAKLIFTVREISQAQKNWRGKPRQFWHPGKWRHPPGLRKCKPFGLEPVFHFDRNSDRNFVAAAHCGYIDRVAIAERNADFCTESAHTV